MRFLKKYKIFESISINLDMSDLNVTPEVWKQVKEQFNTEFVNTLRDFCLELSDSEHDIEIHLAKYAKGPDKQLIPCCCVEIAHGYYIDWYKLVDAIIDINSYVSDFGFKVDIEVIVDNCFYPSEKFFDIGHDEYSAICIIIY